MLRAMRTRFVLLVLLGAGCHVPRVSSTRLVELERRRVFDAAVLDGAAPERALLAAARLQDPAAVEWIAARLTADAPLVRAAAAFALGQLGLAWEPVAEPRRALAEERLLTRLAVERDASVRDAIVEALGKVGGARSLDVLVDALATAERARAAVALGLLAKNSAGKLVSPRALPALLPLVRAPDATVRSAAAYALMRLKDPGARDVLLACAADADVGVRHVCVRGLADVGAPEDAVTLAARVDDRDVRVSAEAARALAKLALRCKLDAPCAALDALAQTALRWTPSAMEAIAFEPIVDARAAPVFAARFDAYARAGDERSPRLACKAALAHDRAVGRLARLPGCGGERVAPAWREALIARALGEMSGGDAAARLEALRPLAASHEPMVRAAAAEALGKLAAPAAGALVLQLLADGDATVTAAAAEAAMQLKLADAAPRVAERLGAFPGPDGIEATQSLLGAVGALAVRAAEPTVRRLLHAGPIAVRPAAATALAALTGETPPMPLDVELPTSPFTVAAAPGGARIETAHGTIRMRFFADDAPATVENFRRLARGGFYDGLTFHRVVPGFVSQGGDPRGDGSGGPGWLIPCEINRRRYGAGAMGMALSGRDTGGSQFFFTHTSQPHLDGRYTVFGEIIEGLDLAASLIEGDRIVRVRLE
jgi:cyclophilin family peptidyl-prolyl cis-trans isomerase/HEAT repeat protein